MASKKWKYECTGKNHPKKQEAVLFCGTCKDNICGDCAVSKEHRDHANSFQSVGCQETQSDEGKKKQSAKEIYSQLEQKIVELNELKKSRQLDFSNLRKTVNDRFKQIERRLRDEKQLLDQGLSTEETLDISRVDNLVDKLAKRKDKIQSLMSSLESEKNAKIVAKIESNLEREVDAATIDKKESVEFRQLALSEENKEIILGCLLFDAAPHSSSDFEGFLLPEPEVLSKFQIRLGKIETVCPINDSEVWIGYSKTDKIYLLEEKDGRMRKKDRYRLTEFQPINISVLSSGDLIFSCAGQAMITTMNKLYEASLYIDTYHLIPLGLYVNEKDEILVCLLNDYSYNVNEASVRQIVKYSADRERAMVIEKDINKQKYFTMPQSVIENVNRDICVVDVIGFHEGRLIVFDKNGGKRFVYNGRHTTDSPQCDLSAMTHDSKGNIILSDEYFNRIHILTKDGSFRGLLEIGKANNIFRPFGIHCDSMDTIWIGCKCSENDDASQLVHLSCPLPE
ncbi:uncharacterized protein LOC133183805 [Saccostrea echinata]|uniref:uncharacterized protein LOC133183805 n=1 Tax=Saccostrea echinata TaxID=191078 RepID=UPI002A83CED5|nr:uncharacterized protein LOC133183805 [Saccostrea echinata]